MARARGGAWVESLKLHWRKRVWFLETAISQGCEGRKMNKSYRVYRPQNSLGRLWIKEKEVVQSSNMVRTIDFSTALIWLLRIRECDFSSHETVKIWVWQPTWKGGGKSGVEWVVKRRKTKLRFVNANSYLLCISCSYSCSLFVLASVVMPWSKEVCLFD